ncbi:DUF732 domain-containing protein [Mycobacterium uberis]|uniref:DUF732 domain-containing protein n=1 Tax=Mycobacterium uberis TaxID=2162698 RepID=A0A3E1HI93_9MYCO|nr:DUF732 domain-containing protein [Mycobacterium uberis]RFD26039.1 DUF732 domain-containing protein [Mycobacterium uberis]
MNTPTRTHRRLGLLRCQPLTIHLLVATTALFTAAATFESPAEADTIDDTFIDALNNAGVNLGEPESTMAMGQSVCPMLAQLGGNFAATVQRVRGSSGMPPQMADTFTRIAISMYCPTMMAKMADGNIPVLMPVPSMPGN